MHLLSGITTNPQTQVGGLVVIPLNKRAYATVLCILFIKMILVPNSLSINFQGYTLLEVNPSAFSVRFLWSLLTIICWPLSISLNSFSVSELASSSILVTLSFLRIRQLPAG